MAPDPCIKPPSCSPSMSGLFPVLTNTSCAPSNSCSPASWSSTGLCQLIFYRTSSRCSQSLSLALQDVTCNQIDQRSCNVFDLVSWASPRGAAAAAQSLDATLWAVVPEQCLRACMPMLSIPAGLSSHCSSSSILLSGTSLVTASLVARIIPLNQVSWTPPARAATPAPSQCAPRGCR